MFKAYLFGVVVVGFLMSAMAQHPTQTINCRIVGISNGDPVTYPTANARDEASPRINYDAIIS